MAIDNTGISSLETGAPDIKYIGDEGPKSPDQELMAQADPMLVEEYKKYVFEMEEMGQQPMSFKQFLEQIMSRSQAEGRGGIQMASAADPLLQEEYDKYVFEMEEQELQPISFEEFRQQAVAGMATGGRVGFFQGALADTKEGKAMSPGTGARGEDRNRGGPPGGGDPGMKYTAPPKDYDRSIDTGPDRFKLAEENRKKQREAEAKAQKEKEQILQNFQKSKAAKDQKLKKYLFAKEQGFGIDEDEYEGELSGLDKLYSGEFGEKYGPYDTTNIPSHPDYEWKGGKDFDEKYGPGFGYIVGPYGNPIYTETGETEGINSIDLQKRNLKDSLEGKLYTADNYGYGTGGYETDLSEFQNYPKVTDQPGFGLIKGLEGLFDAGAVKTRKFFSEPTKDIFGRDQKGVLAAEKFNYKGDPLTASRFKKMSLEEKNKAYKDYMGQRLSGQIDAYGNVHPNFSKETIPHRTADGEIEYREVFMPSGGGDQDRPLWARLGYGSEQEYINAGGGTAGISAAAETTTPATTATQTASADPFQVASFSQADLDRIYGTSIPTTGTLGWTRPSPNILQHQFVADGGRIGYAGGGIADLRQGYFLGNLVKSITKPFKKAFKTVGKVAKSPAGKMALMAFLGNQAGMFGGGTGIFSGLKRNLLGTALPKALGEDAYRGMAGKTGTPGWLGKLGLTKGHGSMMPTALGGIFGTMLGTGLYSHLTQKGDEDDMWKKWLADKEAEDAYWGPRFDEAFADGGRIGYAAGGNDDEEDHRSAALSAMYRPGAQEGGLMDLGGMEKDYRNDGGFVPIGGQERADDVPARLSKNEFVFTADAVRAAGGGDIDKGAEVMENVMENLEKGGNVSEESQGLEGARDMFATSQRLEGVL
jgi:hypothetical protein